MHRRQTLDTWQCMYVTISGKMCTNKCNFAFQVELLNPWMQRPQTPFQGSGARLNAHVMWTARDSTALVRRSARVHIGDVTVYVTWHVLWRTQWTLTTGTVVVTIGVKPAHLQLSDTTIMGPALWGFHYILIIFWQRPENETRTNSTDVTIIETTNHISHYFCFENHFTIGMNGNQIQICPNLLQQKLQWVVLHIQCMFSWQFLNA